MLTRSVCEKMNYATMQLQKTKHALAQSNKLKTLYRSEINHYCTSEYSKYLSITFL